MIKEIIIRIANKISVCKNILKTAVSPTAVNPVIPPIHLIQQHFICYVNHLPWLFYPF